MIDAKEGGTMAILAQLVDDVIVHKFELRQPVVNLGRHPENDIVIDDSSVSAHHARIHVRANPDFPQYADITIEDLGSTNGTFVNDIKLSAEQRLHHQDVVRLAWNQFKLIDPRNVTLGETVHIISR